MAYIYEYIRTRGYEPLHLEEHYARLEALSRSLFGALTEPSIEELRAEIGNTLQNQGYAAGMLNTVCVQCHDNGDTKITTVEMIYNTFSLRAIRPHGFICYMSGDLLLDNTSAKMAALEFNHATAHIANSGVPIWVNDEGELIAIDGAPVVAVFDNEIRFSNRGRGVEFDLAMRCISSKSRKITQDAITVEELALAKELLYIDYRGVTALDSFNGHRYIDITAERIAAQVAKFEGL